MSSVGRCIGGCLLAGAMSVLPVSTHAQQADPMTSDLYSLHAEAEGEVANDLLTVELVVEGEDRDSASLANRINANMQWAMAKLKPQTAIESSTRNYNTWPKYDHKNNRIIGWRASQTLLLESEDFEATRKVIQTLQEKLQVRNMRMTAKAETRTQQEDELINQALNRFKERALIVQLNMGASGYRIMDVSVKTNQHQPPYQPQARGMMAEASVSSAPVIEGGSSRVVVSVSGRIQLQ